MCLSKSQDDDIMMMCLHCGEQKSRTFSHLGTQVDNNKMTNATIRGPKYTTMGIILVFLIILLYFGPIKVAICIFMQYSAKTFCKHFSSSLAQIE